MADSLRFVTCAWPVCRQLFFLCTGCDRGQRYCGRPCSSSARRGTLRAAGRKYQASRDGAHAHARRQARYRDRKVTHHPPEVVAPTVTVPPAASDGAISAPSNTAARESSHGMEVRCWKCEETRQYVRHETLARHRARWARRPP